MADWCIAARDELSPVDNQKTTEGEAIVSATGADSNDEYLSENFERMQRGAKLREEEGAQYAVKCMEEGLKKGQIVRLSEVDKFIRETHEYDPHNTSTGVLKKMYSFVDSDEVLALSMDDGDTVFVHRVYGKEIIEG